MLQPTEVLDDHTIYGDWDDTYGNQVLIFDHPNGVDSHVFIMSGADYGGGIVSHGSLKSNVIQELLKTTSDNYTFYTTLHELVKLEKVK